MQNNEDRIALTTLIDRIEGVFGWADKINIRGERLKDDPVYVSAYLQSRQPEQAGAVPAGDLALTKAVRFTAYNHVDPLAIRFEFADDADRLEAADEINVILSEAFAKARARMAAALAEARIGRDGPVKVRLKSAAPTPPDAGPGEIPAGMVVYGPDQEKIWLALEQAAIELGGAGAHLISSRQSNLWLDIAIRAYANLADTIRN